MRGVMRTELTDLQPPGLHNRALKAAEVLVAMSYRPAGPKASMALV